MNNKNTDNRQQVRIIDKLLHCGLPFALFRAPQHEPTLYLQLDAEVKCLHHDDTDLQGFIYAPFEETQETPTILIRPDLLAHGWGDMETQLAGITASAPMCLDTLTRPSAEQEDASYKTRFHLCLEAIHRGEFNKLVTAKCQCAKGTDHLHDHEATVFLQALEAYPGNMVHLVYTPLTGLWIGASPELFLSQREGIWQTMALAGTQAKGEGTWSAKNIEEQDYVARFIHDLLVSLEATMESE
ncbi:MAG: chorismate-binding protein, partial [Bacteroidales bacterium]|nr:chorismate-binding protein [Candidatus Physcousia equi]